MADQTQVAVACSLTDAAFRERRDTIQRDLFSGQTGSAVEGDGYWLRFPPDDVWLGRIAGFVLAERQCCPFLTFRIEVPAGGSGIDLHLSGPPGSAAFIQQTFLERATTD